jgi:RNA polymerase sigma-70 factor (ECF subfamily)
MESAVPSPAPAAGESDERALVSRSRAGDTAAFAALVTRHRDRAYALALRIVRSPSDAEEVAQDAFVRAWLAIGRFRGESSFGTWLHRIVARKAIDRAVALKARRAREADDAAIDRAAAAEGSEAAERAALARRLDRLMEKLTPPQRAAVALFYREGRSVEQVAATLEMPAGTVKSLLSRARATLREAWEREERSGA